MTEDIGETIDDLYRDRLRTLLSVDDLVSAVVGSLDVSVHGCVYVCKSVFEFNFIYGFRTISNVKSTLTRNQRAACGQ